MTLHAIKSNGMDHAKWSPVGAFPTSEPMQKGVDDVCLIATASYRLMPHIQIAPEGIPPHLCDKFTKCFAPGVIEAKTNRSTGNILLRGSTFDTLTP
jgi:DNA-directed RNA polymerases I and III subunit RPAC1